MPNWVFNSISNYPEEVHEKYKGEDTDIDFDKIIPEPESIKNTPSGSYNGISKSVYRYNQYYENLSDDEKKLLFILLSLPDEIIFDKNEFKSCINIRNNLDYIYKTEELIRPYYLENQKEE